MKIMRIAFLLAMGAVAAGYVGADTVSQQPVQTTHTESVDFAPGGTIRFNDSSGYLSVEGWDQPKIEISIVKSMGYDSEPAAQATHLLDSVNVKSERRSDTEFVISTARARTHNRFTHALGFGRDAAVEYVIRIPRNSHLIVSHANGYVSVTGVTGSIEADNRRGDIVLMLPNLAAYSIDAHTKIGVVTSDLAGSTHMKHLTGETFSHGDPALAHKLTLRMGFGGITIKDLPAEAAVPVVASAK